MAEETVKIVVTETLLVEVLQMATVDLSYRFMYRMVEPIPMMWQADGMIASFVILSQNVDSYNKAIDEFLMSKYKAVIFESKNMTTNEDWAKLQWLDNVNKVKIIECDTISRGAK
jgi:hypothetical protein